MPSRPLTVVEDGGLTTLVSRPVAPQAPRLNHHDAAILTAVRDLLLEQIEIPLLDPIAPAWERNPVVLRVLREAIGRQQEDGRGPLAGLATDEESLLELFRITLGWGPAQAYLDDERIQEVKIVGDLVMVQEDGGDFVLVPERFASAEQPLRQATLLASRLNVQLDRLHPQATLPLAHGTRMHVTIPPCSPESSALVCIRRGRRYAWTLADIVSREAFSQEVCDLLLLLARAGCSFLIAGETGSGKTALLEAIVNSWPGEPHVITIEDNTLEINVRHRAWTRELVQTATEPGAFGRAAKEALRQTPSVVAPGETRAEEAGAILTLAVSGHAIVTTLHAKNCLAAVQRFADCAAMPGAYIYAGRRDNALEDACDNIDLVIHVEKLGGRRYLGAIALLNGIDRIAGALRPQLVPLVQADLDQSGRLVWHCAARAEGDRLVWKRGEEATPPALEQKLRMLRAVARVRAAPTTRAAVEEALARSSQALAAGQSDLALSTLRRIWAERQDQRLVAAAARALESDAEQFLKVAAQAESAAHAIVADLGARRWDLAQRRYETVLADLALLAAYTPTGGWQALDAALRRGQEADTRLLQLASRARQALQAGRAHDALDILNVANIGEGSPQAALQLLAVRRDAVQIQVAAGEAGAHLLDTLLATMAGFERMLEE
jgi:Flp pilus assembly CpaF family ATPase